MTARLGLDVWPLVDGVVSQVHCRLSPQVQEPSREGQTSGQSQHGIFWDGPQIGLGPSLCSGARRGLFWAAGWGQAGAETRCW